MVARLEDGGDVLAVQQHRQTAFMCGTGHVQPVTVGQVDVHQHEVQFGPGLEQPVAADDIAGMARVRREGGGIPIMADESVLDHASLINIIRADAADIVKVKVMKQGGFLNTRRMIATADAAGVRCVLGHGFGLGINTMAEIMCAATSANVVDGLECVGPLKTSDDIVTHKIDMTSGSIALPDGPGLGVVLDDAKIERYRFDWKAAAK